MLLLVYKATIIIKKSQEMKFICCLTMHIIIKLRKNRFWDHPPYARSKTNYTPPVWKSCYNGESVMRSVKGHCIHK